MLTSTSFVLALTNIRWGGTLIIYILKTATINKRLLVNLRRRRMRFVVYAEYAACPFCLFRLDGVVLRYMRGAPFVHFVVSVLDLFVFSL